MKPKLHYSLLTLVAFLGFSSFSLYFNHINSVSDILTAGMWTSMETWSDEDGNDTLSYDSLPCMLDNNWYFLSDSSFLMVEDTLFCDPDSPYLDSIGGKWELLHNDEVLVLSMGGGQLKTYFTIYAVGPNEIELHYFEPADPSAATIGKLILRR